MRAGKFFNTAAVALLLSATAMVNVAHADSGSVSISFGGYDGISNHYGDWGGYRNHDRHDGILGLYFDRRQAEQRERIRDGFRSGDLTPREMALLTAEQREIEHMKRVYLADGYLTPRERQRLENELDAADRHIRKERRDAQDRDGYRSHRRY